MVEFLATIILMNIFIFGLADMMNLWRIIKKQHAETERELEKYWGPDGIYSKRSHT
jgi:hypothetical protein